MSPAPRSVVLALVALVVLALASCTGQTTPTGYGDVGSSTQKNFIAGCTEQAQGLDRAKAECTCFYAGLRKTVPFNELKRVNERLSEDPAPLPAKFQRILEKCQDDPTIYRLPSE